MDKFQEQINSAVTPLIEEAVSELENKMDSKVNKVTTDIESLREKPSILTIPLDFKTKQALNTHIAYPIRHSIVDGATAANYDVFFTADYPCEVVSVSETHRVLGTDGGAVTLTIEKLTSGQALDAGTVLLTTALSLKTTINTPQFGVLVSTGARVLARGDRLALKDAGTLTAVAGVSVTIYVKQI